LARSTAKSGAGISIGSFNAPQSDTLPPAVQRDVFSFVADGIIPFHAFPRPAHLATSAPKMDQSQSATSPPRRYRWPWFVLGFFLLGVVLAVVTVRREVQRVKEQRAPWIEGSGATSSTNAP
jgi:hypothetical protein